MHDSLSTIVHGIKAVRMSQEEQVLDLPHNVHSEQNTTHSKQCTLPHKDTISLQHPPRYSHKLINNF